MALLALSVLGKFQVWIDDVPVSSFESDKVRALLAYLAVEADQAHRRETLVGLLWPDCPEGDARHNLSQALFNLRLALGDHTAKPPYLLITRDAIQFNRASDYSLDLDQFNGYFGDWGKNWSQERIDASPLLTQLEAMARLYRGEFLQQFFLDDSAEFEAWVLVQRETFHQRAMNVLTTLVNEYEQQADYATARRYALRQLELDPWREEAHCQVMRLLALDGQRSAALARYETCRKILVEELGVEPSSQTRELYDQIRSGTLKPKAEPPVPVSSPPIHNLPIPLTPFIGREQELGNLARLIADPECRCITLVGPGGIGKTRLALQAAIQHKNEYAQGSVFIPLASVGTLDAVIPAIANGIGFAFYGPIDPKIQLLNYLRDKQMLLIVDNVEHLLVEGPPQGTIADLLIEILQAAGQVKLLVTSREVLNLQGEWVFEVHGLPVPVSIYTEGSEQDTSVELFLQRARRVHVGFNPTPEDIPAIVHVCKLVEGNPLGIELAAAWVRTLSCDEIEQEIKRGMNFLSVSARDIPARHRSMRAVFDHSWELLNEEEQGVLAQLSTFHGGFGREAAEQVAGATLYVLSALMTKSLIHRSGEGRYDLHELIRQFAAEHLAERMNDQVATQARHGIYYLTFFGQADGRLRSSLQRETLAELTAEIDNFRVAWDWAIMHGEFALIEQTMRTFWMLYDTRSWLQEGLDMLGHAVGSLEKAHGGSPLDRTNQVALGHILTSHAVLATRLGQQQQAHATLERSLEILRPLDEPRVLVETITFLGLVMEFIGNYLEASEFYKEGLEIATAVGDGWYAALCRLLLAGEGSLRLPTSKPENSHEQLKSVVADCRLIGDPRLTAIALNNLSWMAVRLGRYDEACEALEESVLLNTSIGDRWNLGFTYRGLGLIAQAQGEHLQAVDMFRKSLDTLTEVGARQDEARVLVEMSHSIFALENDAEAERGWCQALQVTMETQGTFVALEALLGIATLKAKQGNIERALELLLIVLNHPASLQETKNRADHLRAKLEVQLTSQQVESAQARAQAKTFEVVVDEVLEQV